MKPEVLSLRSCILFKHNVKLLSMKRKVYIIDDHELFTSSLKMMINSFDNYEVSFCGRNGLDLINRLKETASDLPDIILLDNNMPLMSGSETMDWLAVNHPNLNVLVLSMLDDDQIILKMIKKGIKGYLHKDISTSVLKKALDDVINFGFCHSEKVTIALIKSLHNEQSDEIEIKDSELEFLKLSCTELTYKEIAEKMQLSPKTIDGYRETIFKKFGVKSRIGLVLYAIKHGLHEI